VGISIPVVDTYLETGLVPRLPTAVLASSTMLLAFLALTCGLILDTVTHGRREIKRLAYLTMPAPAYMPSDLSSSSWASSSADVAAVEEAAP
jgi:hypothetical protein